MADALNLEEVSHRYGRLQAVNGVALSVRRGEVVCLLGPSGCGKSTVLRIAAGLEELQEGRVLMDGRLVADGKRSLPPEERGVGLVFQDYALFPHLTVLDNVGFGLFGRSPAERQRRAREALRQVGMEGSAEAFPHTLSGGQQQRVALARALAPEPRVMLLDEPFSGLDARLRDQVRDDTLHVLKSSGAATLLVTHDPEEAMFMADRIAVMRAGAIVQEGSPAELYFKPRSAFVASFFSQVNRFSSHVSGGEAGTPFGPVPAAGLPEGQAVEVLIRPEALRLGPADMAGDAPLAKVIAARLLGRSSLIHLCAGEFRGEHLHLHSRMPGRFLPAEDEFVSVLLDRAQAFVFPLEPLT
ncbi:MAG: iron ABC transporter ATP-binding protein [Alphaproteobacteria bacterium]|nr:MAG: iron ABC transporter ATP-binding protein [Alphaproteobacteria bacterium]